MEIIRSEDLPYPVIGSQLPRSDDRPHLTDILKRIGREFKLVPEYSSDSGWELPLAAEIGFMWEEVLSRVMADRMCKVWRPGEVEKDGIVGSPDGIGPDPEGLSPMVLEEYKVTWRSSKNPPTAEWRWMAQVKGYCAMLDLTTVIMRIVYICGDYRGKGPTYRETRIEFTPYEIGEHWKLITGFLKGSSF